VTDGAATPEWTRLQEAVAALRSMIEVAPPVAVFAEEGALRELAEWSQSVPLPELPGVPAPLHRRPRGWLTASGSLPILLFTDLGRRCDGHAFARLAFPARLARLLGAEQLVLCGRAESLSPGLRDIDLVVVSDHINLMGGNPLVGPNLDALGPRFPDLTVAYDEALRRIALTAARSLGVRVAEGVYAGVPGPSGPTLAEAAMLHSLGADVAGTWFVPHVIAARHAGLRVAALAWPALTPPASLAAILGSVIGSHTVGA
jgi:purine nucleoside phosphorylase